MDTISYANDRRVRGKRPLEIDRTPRFVDRGDVALVEDVQSGRKPAETGRPRTKAIARELIIALARKRDWDRTRVLGELRTLGNRAVSRNKVKKILK